MHGYTLFIFVVLTRMTLSSLHGVSNPCVKNPCRNGGICHRLGDTFRCLCPDGYSGPRCQDHIVRRRSLGAIGTNQMTGGQYGNINHNHTSGSYVHGQSTVGMGNANGNGNGGDNNGNTDIRMSTFYCDCSAAFGRNRQDFGSNRCANDLHCYNQGTCYNFNDGSFNSYCSCPAGFTGSQCQVYIKATPGSVRLIGGDRPWSGRVEVMEEGVWRTVCNVGWTLNNAQVVCRQLGFRGVQAPYKPFGQGGNGQAIWSRTAQCFGGEKRLLDCPFSAVNGSCDHHGDVGLDCRPF